LSWQVAIYQGQDGIEYELWINLSVDALFSNNTYFPRTDLQINDPNSVSAAVDSLNSYLSSISNDGSFDLPPSRAGSFKNLPGRAPPTAQQRRAASTEM
jgi:hypothetical protein